jgi:large subunit ribosomal protein L13
MVTRIKPYNPRAKDLVADWHVIDASGEVLGRLASRIAWLLMGKHKPGYVRHLSSGDFVVVINAEKVRTTGKKSEQIVYRRHSQYPGNLKEIPYQRVMETHPTRIIEHAVRGMLPKSKLGDRMYTRLKVYAEETHPHVAQLTGSQRRIERLATEATETAEDAVKAAVQEATSPARRRRRPARPAVDVPEPVVADAAADDAPAVEAPPRPPRRRRRRRTRSAAAAAAVAAGETAAGPATTDAPAAEVEASADNAVGDESSMQRPAGSVQAEGNDDTAADDRNKDVPGDA